MFQFSKLQIDLVLESEFAPGGYWGSRLRGGYGRVLKDGLCDHKEILDCRECPRFQDCDYPKLFEPRRSTDESRAADAPLKHKVDLPRPFIIDAPPVAERAYGRGETVSLGFASLGPLCKSIAYPVMAFERFKQVGIGEHQEAAFRITAVRDSLAGGRAVYESGRLTGAVTRDISAFAKEAWLCDGKGEIEVRFITPLSVVNKNARERDEASGIALFADFYDFVYNLTSRIGGLWQLYGDSWPGQAGFFRWREQLLKASRRVSTTHRDLQVERVQGYSNRQQAARPLCGFTGSMKFEGDFSPFKELLGIGEIVHVGNQTAFGLGRYRVVC